MKKKTDNTLDVPAVLGALRTKFTTKHHLLALIALGVVFLLAALIPLNFIDKADNGEYSGFISRAELFAQYWSGDENGYLVEKIAEPTQQELDYCAERFEEVVSQCRVDRAKETEVKMDGSEYVELSSAGTSLRLCRKWLQYSGDWNSWIDVCFDMQTGEVYYLYTNGECIYNSGKYAGKAPGSANVQELAQIIAKQTGMELFHVDESDDSGAATAIFLHENTPVKFTLSLVYYEGRLFDVKIACTK